MNKVIKKSPPGHGPGEKGRMGNQPGNQDQDFRQNLLPQQNQIHKLGRVKEGESRWKNLLKFMCSAVRLSLYPL